MTRLGIHSELELCRNSSVIYCSKIHPDLLSPLKQSGLFGLTIPTKYNGAGMLYSEMARCYEELGEDLSLSNIVSTNELLGYRALLKFGSEELREKYLPILATGEILAAWCLGKIKSPHYL